MGELARDFAQLLLARQGLGFAGRFEPDAHVSCGVFHEARGRFGMRRIPVVMQRIACVVFVEREAAPDVALDPVRYLIADVIAYHHAPVVSGKLEFIDSQRVEQFDQVGRNLTAAVIPVRFIGLSVAFEVDRQDPELLGQYRHLVVPAVPAFRNAMQQYDRISLSDFNPVPGLPGDGCLMMHE